tara:strand:- start:40 stop:378 length:339 start_codon:yes stop_codon:yes gene_type:complete
MVRCIVLEYPDGHIAIRGGFGPGALASFVNLLRTGERTPAYGREITEIISNTREADLEKARELGLKHLLEVSVPVQNADAISAEIMDVEFPPDRSARDRWIKKDGRITVKRA